MHLGKITAVFQRHVFFKCANSVEKQLLNFRNASVSHCFRNSSLTVIRSNLGLSNYKCKNKEINLEFRKRHIFEETSFYKHSAKYSSQNDGMVERFLFLSDKGQNNSFLNYNRCFF